MIHVQGIPLHTVNEVTLHHILIGIYLNCSKPPKKKKKEAIVALDQSKVPEAVL